MSTAGQVFNGLLAFLYQSTIAEYNFKLSSNLIDFVYWSTIYLMV